MKYHFLRDTRERANGGRTGRRMSCSITAGSRIEAAEIFEERWNAAEGQAPQDPPTGPMTVRPTTLPVITNASLRDQFMAPGALEIKHRTPVFKGK